MKCNIGSSDKILRIILGVIILGAGIFYSSWWGIVGLVLILTGIFKFCPLYTTLGISTCKTEEMPK